MSGLSAQRCMQQLLPLLNQRLPKCPSQLQHVCAYGTATATESTGMRVAHLQSRAVLLAEGPQTLAFLQGLVTNDVRSLGGSAAAGSSRGGHHHREPGPEDQLQSGAPSEPPVYAAILTPKGKLLHDVFIHSHPDARPGDHEAVLLDVGAAGAAAALQLLTRYKLRRPITLRDVSSSYRVMAAWGDGIAPAGPWWRRDPRLGQLGYRALVPTAAAEVSEQAATAVGEAEYRRLRYSMGVAEGDLEMPSGQAAPLDYNLDVLNGVSYTKGCYVGQERNSFTHYRGIIRKRAMPVRILLPSSSDQNPANAPPAPLDLPPGSAEVVDVATGQSVGQLRGAVGGWGLAYLKLQVALAAEAGQLQLGLAPGGGADGLEDGAAAPAGGPQGQGQRTGVDEGVLKGIRVVPVRPGWWSPEWGHEEAGRATPAKGA